MAWSGRRAVIMAVLAGAVAGCASGGSASPAASPASPSPATSPGAVPGQSLLPSPSASVGPAGGLDPCGLVTPSELAAAFGGTFASGVPTPSAIGAKCLFQVAGGAADEGIVVTVEDLDPALAISSFTAARENDLTLEMGVAVTDVGDSAWITKGTVTLHLLRGTTWVDVTKGYGGVSDYSNPEPVFQALTAVARLIAARIPGSGAASPSPAATPAGAVDAQSLAGFCRDYRLRVIDQRLLSPASEASASQVVTYFRTWPLIPALAPIKADLGSAYNWLVLRAIDSGPVSPPSDVASALDRIQAFYLAQCG
jgi:ABC-type transport system substrate-binding protein